MKKIFFAIIIFAMVCSLSATAFAASSSWIGGGGDDAWATAGNWNPGPAPATGETATFDAASLGGTTIDLAGQTVNIVQFNNAATDAYTIGAGGAGVDALNLNNGGAITMTIANTKNQLFNTKLVLGTNGTTQIFTFTNNSVGNTLTVAGSITGSAGVGVKTLAVTGTDDVLLTTGVIGNGGGGGTVAVTKGGAGALTLSGNNTYSGGATLNAGTININNAGALGTGSITLQGAPAVITIDNTSGAAITNANNNAITMNNDLVFTGTNDLNMGTGAMTLGGVGGKCTVNGGTLTIGGIIGGVGAGVEKLGPGTLVFGGANIYTGVTTITAGTLRITNANALAGGGNVLNNNTGTLDIGTNNAVVGAGGYTQGANATLALTANSSSAFGNITSGGNNTLTAVGAVNVTVGGYIPNGATLAILNGATGGSAYGAAVITSSNPYVNFTGSSAGGVYTLTAIRFGTNSFSGAGATVNSNAAAVGGVLDNVTNSSADMFTVLTALGNSTQSQVATSENSMIPTTDGAVTQSSTAMLNNFVNNLSSHLENTRTTGVATGIATGDDCLNGIDIWAQGLGDYAHQDPRGSSNGYNATSWGISGGADKAFYNDSVRVGLGSGYGQTFVRSKDSSGRTDIDSIPATIYCDYINNNLPFYIDAAFTFVYNMYTGSRQVTAGPTITRTANADYNGQQYSGYIEGGYSFFYKKLSLTPLASFQYAHLHTGSYTETNADALNLNVKAQDYDMAQTGLGGKLACPFDNKYGTLSPDLHFKWLYDWVGDNQATTASFAGGGTSFGTTGFNPAQSAYDFGVKLEFKTKYNITIGLDYDFLFKADYYEHYGMVDVKYSF